jgi:hypothetical protein
MTGFRQGRLVVDRFWGANLRGRLFRLPAAGYERRKDSFSEKIDRRAVNHRRKDNLQREKDLVKVSPSPMVSSVKMTKRRIGTRVAFSYNAHKLLGMVERWHPPSLKSRT